jgi:hypothetical protein
MDILDLLEHRDELRKVTAHEWLAAGQAHVVDSHRAEQRNQPGDLLEAQHLGAIEPWEALGGHAVLAAEVAAIRDRHPEVADQPAMAIAERFELHARKA